MSNAFDRVIYNGKLMDKKTRAFVKVCEEQLGYELTITQGCYNPGGVAASAGTHDGGGVLDLSAWDGERKLKVIKDLGGFGWYRPYISGLWGAHLHIGIRNHGNMSAGAVRQQIAYDNRRNGLRSNLHDDSYRPERPRIFQYPIKEPVLHPPNNVQQARNKIVEAREALAEAITSLEKTSPSRVVVWGRVPVLRRRRRQLKKILRVLPKS